MTEPDEIWIPLVDEPIGSIVKQIQREEPDIARLVATPHRILAFRTFAYIRVGVLLGSLLVDQDAKGDDWVEQVMAVPENRQRVVAEVRTVAEEIAADPRYAEDAQIGPDEGARQRFLELARRSRES